MLSWIFCMYLFINHSDLYFLDSSREINMVCYKNYVSLFLHVWFFSIFSKSWIHTALLMNLLTYTYVSHIAITIFVNIGILHVCHNLSVSLNCLFHVDVFYITFLICKNQCVFFSWKISITQYIYNFCSLIQWPCTYM